VAFSAIKKRKLWIIKAVDHCTGRTMAWVLGGRDAATFQRLYDKVKHLTTCIFYTDDWEAFAQVLPKDRHIIGKAYTHAIERDNSNTRHHLARMTRKTKVVSKSEEYEHSRSVFDDPRGTLLSVTRRRSGRQRPCYPGAESPQQAGGEEVLQKAAQRLALRATGAHHG
jgi:insertion element IS1 protein InsB